MLRWAGYSTRCTTRNGSVVCVWCAGFGLGVTVEDVKSARHTSVRACERACVRGRVARLTTPTRYLACVRVDGHVVDLQYKPVDTVALLCRCRIGH